MIKFIAHRDGRPMIGLGLSRGNCQKLLAGKPIFIDLKVMLADLPGVDLNDATILIMGGETEEAMAAILKQGVGNLPKPKTHNDEN